MAQGGADSIKALWMEIFKETRIKYTTMEERIKQELAEYGLTVEQLTKEELQRLTQEIELRDKGIDVLDGVLSDPSIMYRQRK